jgi:hypothetical protein
MRRSKYLFKLLCRPGSVQKGVSSPLQYIQSKPRHFKSRISLAKLTPVIQEDEMHENTEVKINVIEGKHCA